MKTRSARSIYSLSLTSHSLSRIGIGFALAMLSFSLFGHAQRPPDLKTPSGNARLPVPISAEKPVKIAPAGIGAIANVTQTRQDGNLVVTLETSGRLTPKEFLLDNPARLVVDFENAECKVPFLQLPIDTLSVKKLRVRQFQASEPKIARLVFDLADGHGPYEIKTTDQAVNITFRPAADGASAAAKGSQPPANAAPAGNVGRKAKQSDEPVIRDLAGSEIPRSALTQTKEKEASQAEPDSKPAPAAAPPTVKIAEAAVPASPLLMLSTNQDSRYGGQPLTLDLVDIPLVDFFRLMSEEGGINIVMDPEIKGSLSIKVVKVPWDQIFDAALANNGLDKQINGNLVRIARKATLQDEAKQREALKKATVLAADVETRIKRLNYAKAAGFIPTLADQKSVRGTVVVDERTNSLVMTDLPSSLDKMTQLVESLDVPQPQVEIEARIVSATRDFARDIGVQFGFVQGNLDRVTVGGPNTFGTIGGSRPSATPTSTYAAGNPSTGRGASEEKASESAAISTGTTKNDAGNYNVNLPANKAFGGMGMSIGNIFDTFLLDAAITAGESKGLAKLISQPKLTVTNNTPGSITQGLRFPVQVIANNTITVQFQNAALTLTVTPQITYEGNVVLDLKVENNTPDFSRQVGGIPSIRTSESTTRVLVSDGGTTVIGGILIENESNQEDRVPGLASLPMVGNLFRRTSVSRSTQEVLFFVTPRIMK